MQGLIRRETIATELREVLRGIPAYRSTLASECDVFLYARSTPSVEIATSDTEMAVVFDPTAPGQFEAVRSVIARWIDARNGMVK